MQNTVKKWNVHENDFVCLSRNGQLLRNTLYRIGGINNPKPESDDYFMLIKHRKATPRKSFQNMFADARGRIDGEAAAAFQDELGQFVADAINEKMKRD